MRHRAICILILCVLHVTAGPARAEDHPVVPEWPPDEQTIVWGLWRFYEVLTDIQELEARIEPQNFTYEIGRERKGPYGGSAWPVRYRVTVEYNGEDMAGDLVLLFYGKDGHWHTRRIGVFP